MSTKRTWIVTLLLALVLPILAACGGGSGETTGSAGASAGTTTSAPATESSAAASPMASMEASAMASMEASPMASMEASGSASAAGSAAASSASGTGGQAAGAIDFSKVQIEDGATLRVASWGDPSEQAINQQSFERFKAIFPNVTIQYEPSPDQYQTKIQADFAGGTNADVMYVDTALMNALAPNDLLLDLKPTMDELGVQQDDYVGRLTEIFVRDGKVFGLPKDQGALALFVRNDLAEKAGVDPASIKTWDDWKTAAQKMTADGVFGQCTSFDPQRIGALMLQNGATVVQDNKANFADPKAVEAVQFWYDMVQQKHATLPREVGADWCGQALGQGKTAMAVEGGWMLPYLEKDFADVEYTALAIPTPPNGQQASLVFTNAWGAAANTKFPKAAAALAIFLTSAQNQKPIMETGFALPTVETLLEDPYFEQNPNAKVLAEAGTYGTPAFLVFGQNKQDDVIKPVNTALEGVWTGGGDIQQALEAANQEAQTVLDAQ